MVRSARTVDGSLAVADLNTSLQHWKREVRGFYDRTSPAFHPLKVRPCLQWALVPRPRAKASDDEPPAGQVIRSIAGTVDRGLSAALGGAGLVEGEKSDATEGNPSRRHGRAGLPPAGGLAIQDFCALTRREKSRFGMWTVTIGEKMGELLEATPDGWARFQDTIRRRFSEAHRRACTRESKRLGIEVPCHWAFVVEVQGNGRPHLHVVFRCKGSSGRRWLLNRGHLDGIIRQALWNVTGQRFRCQSAGNVQTLRRDPGSYLGRYLKKGRKRPGTEAIMAAGYSFNMVPKQWWGRSAAALEWTREHTFEVPASWSAWLSLHWPQLVAAGMVAAALVHLPGDGAPSVICGRFRGVRGLESCLAEIYMCSAVAQAR
jgi:hypothetical protein